MPALNSKAILECSDMQTKRVDIPEWNGYVFVRSLTGKERDAWETSLVVQRGKKREVNTLNMRAKLVALVTVDEEGQPIFSQDQVEALSLKNSGALDRIFDVAQRLSGIGDRDVEALVKNSDPDQDTSSISV